MPAWGALEPLAWSGATAVTHFAPSLEHLHPLERLATLCDASTVQPIRTAVEGATGRPGDGVVAAAGLVRGRPVFCYAYDPTIAGGSLGETGGRTIERVLDLADRAGAPVVGLIASGGARLQEGVSALGTYARLFRRTVELQGRVPQISVVTGIAAGGACYMPALTDFIVMTKQARMFLTGPRIVERALGETVDSDQLGGLDIHARNGVCDVPADNEEHALDLARELIGYLSRDPVAPPSEEALSHPEREDLMLPAESRRIYDVRVIARALVDAYELLEVSPRWARNMFTGFGRLGGMPVGIVANQPRQLGGVIDAAASEKAALFVKACDRFGLPLVVLVDTPGFMPGTKQESAGIIRRGAELVRAFAGASVPKVTVVLRKAFGGAYITMNSKDLGADLVLAWPTAQIGIMAAAEAVAILHRERLVAADGNAAALASDLAADYAERHLTAEAAARGGFVDEIIDPSETRERLRFALWALREHDLR